MEEVQKELGITDEQKTELMKLAEAARRPGGGGPGSGGPGGGFDFEAFQKLSDDEKKKQWDDLRKVGEEQMKKSDEAIQALLQPEQLTRLSELRNQREGVRSLGREEVQKQLGLSEEQVTQVKDIIAAQPQGFGGPGGGRNFQDMTEEDIQKARAEREVSQAQFAADIAAVLTPEQATAWQKAQGAKFEFPAGRGGRGGAGGGTGRRRPE